MASFVAIIATMSIRWPSRRWPVNEITAQADARIFAAGLMIHAVSPKDSFISIIVPTFREAPNIEPLVRRTFTTLREAGITAEMIIVDDDSQDGTTEIVERLAESFPVRIVVRKTDRGLATAVVEGFAHAKGDILVVMDGDLQHPPESVPALVTPVASGHADFALGSRHAPGAEVAGQWTNWRRLNSFVATMLARPLIRLCDPMSGFFALRRETWLQARQLNPVGYKIGLELAVRCGCQRCVEIPFAFSTRHAGDSKLTARQQLEYIRQLGRLYWFRFKGRLTIVALLLLSVTLAASAVF